MQVIKSLYERHFQKSKVFLYPALGIGRQDLVTPVETYISWKGHYEKEDQMLICLYKKDYTSYIDPTTGKREYILDPKRYTLFVNRQLDNHSMFVKTVELEIPYIAYVFRYPDKHDWHSFLEGKYSKFSDRLKKRIRSYFAQSNTHYAYVDSYISPERYYGMYSEILGVHINLLREVVELCEKPNIEKETFELIIGQKQTI